MDADVSMSSEDDYLQYFDLTPAHFPWRAPRPREIEERRARMSDLLIFDVLLSSGGIRQPHTLFPPADPEALERLLEAITHSNYDGLKKDCLVYFLLKWHQDGREEDFKYKRCILPQFAALADAYWHLDSGINIARAISLLSDARINKDYTSKVLQALSQSADPHSLIRTFIRTAKPLLTEPDDIDAYAIALAESSLMEAWSYQRSFPEASDTRKRLIRKVLDWCLTSKPRLMPLTNLLAFPLSPYEQSLVHEYALDPPSMLPASSVPIIQDLVCVRLVQNGQHAAAIKLDRQFASLMRGGDRVQKAAHERRQMMDELMAAMPVAERQLLELELEQFAQGRGMNLSESLSGSIGPGAKGKGKAMDSSMSMSWEHISPPTANGHARVTVQQPTPPIPQRSGAPRFGGPSPAPQTSEGRTTTSAVPQMPRPPSQGPLLFGGISAQPSSSTSASATSDWKPKVTPNGASPSLFAGIGNGKQSLFDTAGSANATPNAFYQPPTSGSANAKRPILFSSMTRPTPTSPPPVSAFASLSNQPAATTSAKSGKSGRKSGGGDTSFLGPHDADISMLSELSDSDSARGADDSTASVARALDNSADMSAEFSVSVFGHQRKIATDSGSRIARTETEARLPPGAFLPEDDRDKQESQSISATQAASASAKGRAKRARPSASGRAVARDPPPVRAPEPQPKPKPEPVRTRISARRKVVKDKDLNRSIPGSLMDDDDDSEDAEAEVPAPQQGQTEEEDDDNLAPLPTPPRRPRKSRAPNAGAVQIEGPRVTRRSSRLSAVGSVGSSSPEPMSPQKASARLRKSARASTAGAGAGAKAATGAKTRKRKS
ncbi:nuclear pore complex assembly-domain-containing protein [Daedaleopsis nitida]|nr:nuclear pore complex assembly-domain-containing protein [Daedaleopsis nitida]